MERLEMCLLDLLGLEGETSGISGAHTLSLHPVAQMHCGCFKLASVPLFGWLWSED